MSLPEFEKLKHIEQLLTCLLTIMKQQVVAQKSNRSDEFPKSYAYKLLKR